MSVQSSERAQLPSNHPSPLFSVSLTKKRSVHRRTVEKWITENDRAMNTATWLKFEMADRDHMAVLKCAMRNYRPPLSTVLATYTRPRLKSMHLLIYIVGP